MGARSHEDEIRAEISEVTERANLEFRRNQHEDFYLAKLESLLEALQRVVPGSPRIALFHCGGAQVVCGSLLCETSEETSQAVVSTTDLFGIAREEERRLDMLPFPEIWREMETREFHPGELEDRRVASLLSVPLALDDGEPIGRLLIWASAPMAWPESELSEIQEFAYALAGALKRWKTLEEQDQICGLAALLSEMSRQFINLPSQELRDAFDSSLAVLGDFLKVDSASVHIVTSDGLCSERRYEWLADGAAAEPESTRLVPLDRFTWFAQCYREGTPVAVSSPYDIPSYAAAERAMVSSLRAKSFILLPMHVSGRTVGHVGFGNQKSNRRWSHAEIEQLRTIGDLFAVGFDRYQKGSALIVSETRYQTIVDDLSLWILRWLPDGTRTFVNQTYCERFGRTPKQLKGTNFLAEAHPEDCLFIQRKIARLALENPVITDQHRVRQPDGTIRWEEWTDRGFFDGDGNLVEIQSAGRDVTEERMIREREQARHHEFQQQLIHRQEAERARIARGLHDELGQSLTGMRMQLRNLQKYDREITDSDLLQLLGTVERVIPEVRRICAELRPSSLDHLGLIAAIESHLDRFAETSGLTVHREILIREIPSDATRDINVFRIVQELLTNVAKHADATAVWVTLRMDSPNQLFVEVKDDGCGASADMRSKPGHFGLLGLHERAAVIGAGITYESETDSGLQVGLVVPVSVSGEYAGKESISQLPSEELKSFMNRHE